MRPLLLTLLLFALTIILPPAARGRSSSPPRAKASSTPRRVKAPKPAHAKVRCASCPRDPKGKIVRSAKAKRAFQKSHPCPSTGKTAGVCPGYVIDHVIPLKRGGLDAPGNMQWQSIAAAKAKDKIE